MTIFSKPTDSKQYLPRDLNHPKPCVKISLIVLPEIYSIVEDKNMKLIKLEELKTTLMSQRYPQKIIEKGIEKALSIPLQTICSHKTETN